MVSSWMAGDELLGAGDLEVHVAVGVLGTEDVGERDIRHRVWPSTSAEIRPIAMPATGARSGTPALSSDRVEAQTEPHRGGAVGAHRLGDLTDRVGELLAARQHRHEARSASAPWPTSRRFGEPTRPVSPVE